MFVIDSPMTQVPMI